MKNFILLLATVVGIQSSYFTEKALEKEVRDHIIFASETSTVQCINKL